MPRPSTPHWIARLGCYRFRYRRHDYYLRGIARNDVKALRKRVAEITAEADRDTCAALSVSRLCQLYLLWSQREHAKRTTEGHVAMLDRFCAFRDYASRPAASITATDLARLDKLWIAHGYANGYRAQLYKSVLACWAWAARPEPDRVPERLLESNPLAGMRRPRVHPRLDRLAERHELAAFLRHARGRINAPWRPGTRGRCIACTAAKRPAVPCQRSHAASVQMLRDALVLVRLIGETGCRPGEACSARWADWTPQAGTDEHGHWWGTLKLEHKNRRWTGGKRTVVVPPVLVRAIERIRARPGRHMEYIFTHRRGRGAARNGHATAAAGSPWNTTALDRRLRAWRDELIQAALDRGAPAPLGTTFVPYALRHAFYSAAAPKLGAELAGLLGGTSGAVVRRRYLHSREQQLIEAAQEARNGKG